MKLTDNFDLSEFKCNDGTDVPQELLSNVKSLAIALQTLRQTIGYPVYINSAYRTEEYNKIIGGSKNSQHLLGKAADIRVAEMIPAEVYDVLEALIELGHIPEGGLGKYETFVHYDIRLTKARWKG